MLGEILSQFPVHGNLGVRLTFILVRVLGSLSNWLLSVTKRSFWSIYDQCFWLLSLISIRLCDTIFHICQYYEEGYCWLSFLIKGGILTFGFKNFVEEEYSCSPPRILELPEEVMEMIVQHLSLRDRIRMSNVCRSWRNLLTSIPCHPPEFPWLLFLNPHYKDLGGNSLSFYRWCDNKFIKLRLPDHIRRARWDCLLSSNGWLLIAVEVGRKNCQLLLLDPLSRKTLNLPSPSTLPFFDEYVKWMMSRPEYCTYACAYFNTVRRMIEQIAVSASPADCINANDLVVAATFDVFHYMEEKMAFCKPSDKEWTIFHQDADIHPPYSGLLFYKGCLHANRYIYGMNLHWGGNGITTECTISLSANVNLKVIFNDIIVTEHPLTARERNYSFFVDSAEGDLLRVVQNKHLYEDGEHEGVTVDKTIGFDVFNYGSEEKLISLGDQVLFLSGSSGPASFSSRTSNCWVRRNSICFQASWTKKHHKLGVFDVENKLIKPFIPGRCLPKTRALWFTPKCRSTWFSQ